MEKAHNPPLHGQKFITILLIWMMYARKERGGGRGYASCEMSGRANWELEKL
jgi:hypothetical protein